MAGGRGLLGTGVLALVSAALLPACTPEIPSAGPEAVEITGPFGQLPTVTFDVPFAVRETTASVVHDGDGPPLDEGMPILVDWIALDGSTGEVIDETYTGAPDVFTYGRETMGEELFTAVSAAGINDRVLYLEPARGDTGLPASHIVVVDVRPARAQGEPVAPEGGLPQVSLAENGAPTVKIPGSHPPPDLVEQVLIRGPGAQVQQGAELLVQFTAVRWSDGGVEATTWDDDGLPVRLDLETANRGLQVGLLDKTVGSQVLLVVPRGQALGTDTLVYVVDILAVVSDPAAEPTPEPTGTAAPGPTEATG